MKKPTPITFKAIIEIIGINPFVFIPEKILEEIFAQAGKDKSPIPITGTINSKPYKQTLMKYRGEWRLYINTIMLKDSPNRIGEEIAINIEFDPEKREIPIHPMLLKALEENPHAKKKFDSLTPSLKKEIVRYIANLKTESSINKNVKRSINFLLGKERFIGRDPI